MAIISDGTGTSVKARVDESFRLEVHAQNDGRHEAINTGKVWSLDFSAVDPAGADDYFAYIKNTSSDESYLIPDIRFYSTVAGSVHVHKVTGAAVYAGETAMGITSRNFGTAVLPSVTADQDTDITGLTDSGRVFTEYLEANKQLKLSTSAGMILTPGTAVALMWSSASGILNGTITLVKVFTHT